MLGVDLRPQPQPHPMLKQYVWGLQYIDELCQIGLNLDPNNKDTKHAYFGMYENLADRFFYALQDANYNVLGVIGEGGYLAERYEYTPYGQRTVYSHGVLRPDITGDGYVGTGDLDVVLGHWGQSTEAAQVADLNGDGYVSSADLDAVNSHWNQSTPIYDPRVTYPTLRSARSLKLSSAAYNLTTAPLCEVGHQGLFHDEEFGSLGGLIHNRARTLHARLGRFMQRDPLGFYDSMSRYLYVRANPISLQDYLGLLSTAEAGNRAYSLGYLDAVLQAKMKHAKRNMRTFGMNAGMTSNADEDRLVYLGIHLTGELQVGFSRESFNAASYATYSLLRDGLRSYPGVGNIAFLLDITLEHNAGDAKGAQKALQKKFQYEITKQGAKFVD